jgi:glutamate-1-semialdehyde 2,1-aminomutase
MRHYTQSQQLFERASNVLAGGVSSEFRKSSPLFFTRAEGVNIWDADGNRLLDFALSQGPMILGHSNQEVLNAVASASACGQLFAGQHLLELELAETLQRLIPSAERLRFCLSGSEAVHAGLRLARACTGRSKFVRFLGHYHGWLDSVAFGINQPGPWTEGLPDGICDEAFVLPWNDLTAVETLLVTHSHEIAAIITEPWMCNTGCTEPMPGFLEGLRTLCDQYGVLLIFDEVITGFRLSLGGAQAYFNITPDLAIFGKALASGYPIAALCGKERWMRKMSEGTVIHAGTMNSGNPSVAAALATLRVLERTNPYPQLFALGEQLREGLTGLHPELCVTGPGPMVWSGFADPPRHKAFVGALQEQGVRILARGLWYISAIHTEEDVQIALIAAKNALASLRKPRKSNV